MVVVSKKDLKLYVSSFEADKTEIFRNPMLN
jgi:hypothetical protein